MLSRGMGWPCRVTRTHTPGTGLPALLVTFPVRKPPGRSTALTPEATTPAGAETKSAVVWPGWSLYHWLPNFSLPKKQLKFTAYTPGIRFLAVNAPFFLVI